MKKIFILAVSALLLISTSACASMYNVNNIEEGNARIAELDMMSDGYIALWHSTMTKLTLNPTKMTTEETVFAYKLSEFSKVYPEKHSFLMPPLPVDINSMTDPSKKDIESFLLEVAADWKNKVDSEGNYKESDLSGGQWEGYTEE